MTAEFIIIGQHMADDEGVVLLVGEPIEVRMHEEASTRAVKVTVTAEIKPGYRKYRAATFEDAMAHYHATLELEK